MGLKACYIAQEDDFLKDVQKYNYIIAAPESVTSDGFIKALDKIKQRVTCIFIDESHCVHTL